MRKLAWLLLALVVVVPEVANATDQPLPYSEGTVWRVQTIRVKTGLWEEYVRTLAHTRKVLDEAKKQKLLLSYKILIGDAATERDWNLMLLIEYKNMAALDGLPEKMRAIAGTVVGDENARKDLAVKRLDLREVLGEKAVREIVFK
jgi:hypothetical protein